MSKRYAVDMQLFQRAILAIQARAGSEGCVHTECTTTWTTPEGAKVEWLLMPEPEGDLQCRVINVKSEEHNVFAMSSEMLTMSGDVQDGCSGYILGKGNHAALEKLVGAVEQINLATRFAKKEALPQKAPVTKGPGA